MIEQITYLLFIKRLDDLHTAEENKANRLRTPMRRIFPEGDDDLRWSRFKSEAPAVMFETVGQRVFPFLHTLGRDGRPARTT